MAGGFVGVEVELTDLMAVAAYPWNRPAQEFVWSITDAVYILWAFSHFVQTSALHD